MLGASVVHGAGLPQRLALVERTDEKARRGEEGRRRAWDASLYTKIWTESVGGSVLGASVVHGAGLPQRLALVERTDEKARRGEEGRRRAWQSASRTMRGRVSSALTVLGVVRAPAT